ncbi:GNAT family N-acetyltransferase [Neiella marina]|uniref:GNAT family N-acetyltransferase n=1 Tax=Neiella holothuriorum TaxID=2870530 RepID=A0ABS7EKS1_9GAMM|nr:GNAT family N-acetyltransferase [Neiella holothuriorum]MBW8192931.1 GNAT family N-acetyltransferase [Neiella holothuriorum]
MSIEVTTKADYERLIEVWEASVRATHDFLPEKNIAELKPLILKHYFDAVELRCFKSNNGVIGGFIGVAENNIEMLFIAPEFMSRGFGKRLVEYAVEQLRATKVDVNEQNSSALAFYEHLGFVKAGRSPLDGQGNPFPLIHMNYNNASH